VGECWSRVWRCFAFTDYALHSPFLIMLSCYLPTVGPSWVKGKLDFGPASLNLHGRMKAFALSPSLRSSL
jgi:hypothetical protein